MSALIKKRKIREAFAAMQRLGVIAPRYDDIEEFFNTREVQERLSGEYRIHRKYYEKKKHVRMKVAKAIETIEYYEQVDETNGTDHTQEINAHIRKIKYLTK